MSTEIKVFTGKIESENSTLENPKYDVSLLALTSFYGGIKRGKSLQISIEGSYSQLSNKQVLKLIKTLKKHYKENKSNTIKSTNTPKLPE